MNEERQPFAKRLREGLTAVGYPARPSVLHKLFNTRYNGPSASQQSVSRWLRGTAIPEQDKLQVLAWLISMPPNYLRYGDESAVRDEIQVRQRRHAHALASREFQMLTSDQQTMIYSIIDEFTRLNFKA